MKPPVMKAKPDRQPYEYKGCHCYKCKEADYNKLIADGSPVSKLAFWHPVWLMILCVTCGNKRCPHATNHKLKCTGSNEPGQKGSDYE